jgi:hypothetical protein
MATDFSPFFEAENNFICFSFFVLKEKSEPVKWDSIRHLPGEE